MILHVSINALDPERVASVLAELLGGKSAPFPPFPDSWIAFTRADNGIAIEVYPTNHQLEPGSTQVVCRRRHSDDTATFAHVAIASPLASDQVIAIGLREGWLARCCNRGPFQCVELWVEGRLLIEVLDEEMQRDYRTGMTAMRWAAMFEL